jgi:hypothetical protein
VRRSGLFINVGVNGVPNVPAKRHQSCDYQNVVSVVSASLNTSAHLSLQHCLCGIYYTRYVSHKKHTMLITTLVMWPMMYTMISFITHRTPLGYSYVTYVILTLFEVYIYLLISYVNHTL